VGLIRLLGKVGLGPVFQSDEGAGSVLRSWKFPFLTSSVVGTVRVVGRLPLTAVPDSHGRCRGGV